jgi:hypothetical protein
MLKMAVDGFHVAADRFVFRIRVNSDRSLRAFSSVGGF